MQLIFARRSKKLLNSFNSKTNQMKFRFFFIFMLPTIILLAYITWAWMSPKYSVITVSSVINAPQNIVYPEIAQLTHWSNWVSFTEKDPSMELTILNLKSNLNQGVQWKGKESLTGKGELKLVSSNVNHKFLYELELNSPKRLKSNGEIQIQMKSFISSTVNITNNEEISFMKRPLMKWFNHANIIRKECERSLARLDSICINNSNEVYSKAQSTINIMK